MSEPHAERWPAWPATVALCAAVVLALCSLRGGFWLDEILASKSAWTSAGWLAWIGQVHREDPHYLTILWMRLVGRDHGEALLRAPSMAFALATLLLVHRAARDDGPRGQLVSMVIWGGSWLFVCYAGEARGYSGVIFHSLVALLIERRIAAGNATLATCALGGLNYTIGLLSQPILLAGVLASAAWLALLVVRRRISWRHGAAVVGPPLALLGLLVFTLGSPFAAYGPHAAVMRTFLDFLRFAVGGPELPAALGAGLAIVLLGWPFVTHDPRVRPLAGRNVLWVLSMPVLLLVRGAEVSYARYYLVALPPLLWTASACVLQLWRKRALAATILLTLYAAGQATGLVPFLRYARGEYQQAISAMVAQSDSRPIAVASNQEFRSRTVLEYYWRTRGIENPLDYIDAGGLETKVPDWVLLNDLAWRPMQFPPSFTFRDVPFSLVGEYPKGALSGWYWFVYHRVGPPPPA